MKCSCCGEERDQVDEFDPAENGAGCYLVIDTVDEFDARFAELGLSVTPLADQPWCMREFTFSEPSGNHLRIGRGA